MNSFRLSAFLIVLSLMLIVSTVAAVENTQPHVFAGRVTVDGEAVPPGTEIIALVGGHEEGSFQVYNHGEYSPLHVGPPASGSLITFWVNGHPADQALTWEKHGSTSITTTG